MHSHSLEQSQAQYIAEPLYHIHCKCPLSILRLYILRGIHHVSWIHTETYCATYIFAIGCVNTTSGVVARPELLGCIQPVLCRLKQLNICWQKLCLFWSINFWEKWISIKCVRRPWVIRRCLRDHHTVHCIVLVNVGRHMCSLNEITYSIWQTVIVHNTTNLYSTHIHTTYVKENQSN